MKIPTCVKCKKPCTNLETSELTGMKAPVHEDCWREIQRNSAYGEMSLRQASRYQPMSGQSTADTERTKYVCRNCGKPFWTAWEPVVCPHCEFGSLFAARSEDTEPDR